MEEEENDDDDCDDDEEVEEDGYDNNEEEEEEDDDDPKTVTDIKVIKMTKGSKRVTKQEEKKKRKERLWLRHFSSQRERFLKMTGNALVQAKNDVKEAQADLFLAETNLEEIREEFKRAKKSLEEFKQHEKDASLKFYYLQRTDKRTENACFLYYGPLDSQKMPTKSGYLVSHANGTILTVDHFENGVAQGNYVIINDDDTCILERGNLKDGKCDGEVEYFDSSGNLTRTAKFKDGKQCGASKGTSPKRKKMKTITTTTTMTTKSSLF